jgi:hypothetical protein
MRMTWSNGRLFMAVAGMRVRSQLCAGAGDDG